MAFISSFSSISIQCNKPSATVTSISATGFWTASVHYIQLNRVFQRDEHQRDLATIALIMRNYSEL